jgi:hypothetical protein
MHTLNSSANLRDYRLEQFFILFFASALILLLELYVKYFKLFFFYSLFHPDAVSKKWDPWNQASPRDVIICCLKSQGLRRCDIFSSPDVILDIFNFEIIYSVINYYFLNIISLVEFCQNAIFMKRARPTVPGLC